MNKIKKISFYARRVLAVLIFVLPVFIILQWMLLLSYEFYQSLLTTLSYDWTSRELVGLNDVVWTWLTRTIACCSQLVAIAPFLGILYYFGKVFHRYERGEIFTMENAKSYYNIGRLLFFDALLAQPLSGALWTLATTLSNPVGERSMRVSIGTPNLHAIFTGLLVIFISWIMIEGYKIQNEQKLTI